MPAIVGALAAALFVVALAVGIGGGRLPHQPGGVMTASAPAPPAATALMPLTPVDARAANTAQPFRAMPIAAAAPFRFTGDAAASARATDCLAAAVLYEAGDDADGQRAVAQVVLNRVRDPAFPKSVCGVVFQGSARMTGCQFTFTCDGALARRWSATAWQAARGIAIDALAGAVYRPVGPATHYHTDWVRPYWAASLDKLTMVGTHIFYVWRGGWRVNAARNDGAFAPEPVIAALAALSSAHAGPGTAAIVSAASVAAVPSATLARAVRTVVPAQSRDLGDSLLLTLDAGMPPDSWPAIAATACADRSYCKVMGWTHAADLPDRLPISDTARAAMAFSYLRNAPAGLERALWNCHATPRPAARDCMRR